MYTDLQSVLAELPSDEPKNPVTKVRFTPSEWAVVINRMIAFNTSYIDENIAGYLAIYDERCFPGITDDPVTPSTIEKICRYLTRCDALTYYSGTYSSSDNSERQRLRKWADDTIKKIRDGEINISIAGVGLRTCALGSVAERAEPVFDETDMDCR